MRQWLALAVVLSGTFLANLDVFIVVVAMPALERGLHADDGQQQLILAGYQLVYGLGLIAGGRLGDHLGSFRVFGAGMVLFTAASLGCGLAPSAGFLVTARLAQGLGTALLVPQVFRMAQTLFTGRARRQAFAVTGAVMGIGAVSGQLLGGWLLAADTFGLGWRAVFLVNVPVGAAALAALPWAATAQRAPAPGGQGAGDGAGDQDSARTPRLSLRARLDLPGTALAALASGLFAAPLTAAGGKEVPWWAPFCLAASVPATVGFLRYERAVQRRGGCPLLPPGLLSRPGFGRGLALVALANCGLNAFVLTLGLLLQQGYGWSPLRTGAGMLPTAGAFACASLLAPRLPVPQSRLLCGAAALATAGYLGCAAAAVHGEPGRLLLALGVAGAGLGLFIAPALAFALGTVPDRVSGAAAGVVSTVQQLGAALGVCVFGALFFALVHAGTGHPTAFALVTVANAVTTALGGFLARGVSANPVPSPGSQERAAGHEPGGAGGLL
ncbi:MFS transporter [Streptomyces iconiensis]|uniref:MFS transporter n=1 Tax=Streptomyces iconiensis TaxID=1384038 RepID=A0ABT7A9Q5_9ACTN|nr:MFS transporter [Streptomyces iconiensis]MDJ1138060.1 MFS transporter [Streptomyces iconiensis]